MSRRYGVNYQCLEMHYHFLEAYGKKQPAHYVFLVVKELINKVYIYKRTQTCTYTDIHTRKEKKHLLEVGGPIFVETLLLL